MLSFACSPSTPNNNNINSEGACGDGFLHSPPLPQVAGSFSRNQETYSVEEVWPGIEAYLLHSAHVIRTGNAEMKERLQNVRTRMSWYAVIYSTCSGSPMCAHEMYRRLVLFLINDLEVNVLRPFLRRESNTDSSSSSYSICQHFILQYRMFIIFRRVVLSCFGYLDQYYTTKFSLDPVTVLCVKLFYMVVYKPIREKLVDGLLAVAQEARVAHQSHQSASPASTEVQQTLMVITEILSVVKAFSAPHDGNTQKGGGSVLGDGMEMGGECGRNRLDRIMAELERSKELLGRNGEGGKCTRDMATWLPVASSHKKNSSRNSSESGVISSGAGDKKDNVSPTQEQNVMGSIALDNIRILRESFESRTIADLITGQMITGNSNNNTHSSGCRGGSGNRTPHTIMTTANNSHGAIINSSTTSSSSGTRGSRAKTLVDLAQVVIVNAPQPFYLLVFADFGVQYISAAEAYYRDQRTLQLAQPTNRYKYVSWVQECLEFERYMVRDVMMVSFHTVLREQLQRVLLVEIHRLVILDEKYGFRAQLDAWSGRNGPLTPGMLQNTSPTPTTTTTTTTTTSTATVGCSSSPVKSWEQLSDDELLHHIRTFAMTLINTQDESSLELLASEFASKIVTEIADLFVTYMTLMGVRAKEQERSTVVGTQSIHLDVNARDSISHASTSIGKRIDDNTVNVIRKPRDATTTSAYDLAMALAAKLVDATIKYSSLLQKQFDSYLLLQSAMRDAFHKIINPEQWGQLGVRIPPRGSVAATTLELPSVLLNHDAAKKTFVVLEKLSTMRGNEEIPISQFLANYCDHLCRREVNCDVDNHSVTARMDAVVYLTTLITDKDVFLEHYKLLLAHRLLMLRPPLPSMSAMATGRETTGISEFNVDGERFMLCKFQHILGRTLTYALEAMLRDYESTLSGNDRFLRVVEETKLQLPAEMRVRVLTAVHWPTYRVVPLIPCASLAVGMEAYTEYYRNLHPSRTLHWIHTLGTATLHAVFPRGTKEVVANTMQSHILILVSNAYNAGRSLDKGNEDAVVPSTTATASGRDQSGGVDGDGNDGTMDTMSIPPRRSISGQDIATAMGMDFKTIRVHLAPLVHHKTYNLLTRVKPSCPVPQQSNEMPTSDTTTTTTTTSSHFPAGVDTALSPEDEFTLNLDYTHRLRKFRLPVTRVLPVLTAGGKGRSCTADGNEAVSLSAAIEDTRRLQINAAIIRVMKSRRSLRYYELFDATVEQLSKLFTPRPRAVKTQVEDLVGCGFVRRSETDATVFVYIA